MYPSEDIERIRDWAEHRSDHHLVVVLDGSDVIVAEQSGTPVARLHWMEELEAWRLLTLQKGSLRDDPLSPPTPEVQSLLPCVGLDAGERLLG